PDPRDRMSVEACQYIFDWVTTVYNDVPLPPLPAGGACATTGATPNVIGALNPSVWTMTLPGSTRSVTKSEAEQKAFFGEVTIGLTQKLDMTLGVRITEDSSSRLVDSSPPYTRNQVSDLPQGDIYAFDNPRIEVDPDFGRNTTNKFALQYQMNDDIMLYGSWGEGFTEGTAQILTLPVVGPGGCPSTVDAPVVFPQNREIVTSREIGLRSDWLDRTLRFNASYFDASWNGMRVATLALNPCTGDRLPQTVIKSDGRGEASGFEFEVIYAPTARMSFNFNLGVIDTQYLDTGAFIDQGNDLSGTVV